MRKISEFEIKTADPFKAVIRLDRPENFRAYFDLDVRETKWLRGVAAEFGLTIEVFVRRFYTRTLPRPAYPLTQFASHKRKASHLAMFKVTCSDSAVWRQLLAIAKYQKLEGGAQEECVTSILATLEMWNGDILFSPKTGEVICENDEVEKLAFQTCSDEEPPRMRDGRAARGFLRAEPSNAACVG
jgi:hypothetical protein